MSTLSERLRLTRDQAITDLKLLLLFMSLDVVTTYIGLAVLGTGAELNPLMHIGGNIYLTVLVSHLLFFLPIIYVIRRLDKRPQDYTVYGGVVFRFVACVYMVVVIWNVTVLTLHGLGALLM